MPDPITLRPQDFGEAYLGVHLFLHGDDWGWTAYGHHQPRRIIAAIARQCRSDGLSADLRLAFTVDDLRNAIEYCWAADVHAEDGLYSWDWTADPSTPGAVPLTMIVPSMPWNGLPDKWIRALYLPGDAPAGVTTDV